MAKSLAQIQKDSDDKRELKVKGFKLKLETIALIEQLAKQHGMAQNELITLAVQQFDPRNTSGQ